MSACDAFGNVRGHCNQWRDHGERTFVPAADDVAGLRQDDKAGLRGLEDIDSVGCSSNFSGGGGQGVRWGEAMEEPRFADYAVALTPFDERLVEVVPVAHGAFLIFTERPARARPKFS